MLRAVLFDLGGTLIHLDRPSEDVFHASLQAMYGYLKQNGLQGDSEKFAKTYVTICEDADARCSAYKVEIPEEDIVLRILRELKFRVADRTVLQNAISAFHGPEIEACQVYPDTIQTLSGLKDEGFLMGMVSNSISDWTVHAKLEKFGLQRFFGVILSSEALGIRKPRSEIFMRALKALEVGASEAVFVGDSLQSDVIGARTVGIRSIYVRRKPTDPSDLTDPDATVTSLSEAFGRIIDWRNHSLKTGSPVD